MKQSALFVILALVLAVGAGAARAAAHGDSGLPSQEKKAPLNVAGKWAMTLEMSMGAATPALELKQDGENLTGTYTGRYGTFPIQGTLKAQAIVFSFSMSAEGESVNMSFLGEVAADAQSMKGTATIGPLGDATWTAKRQQ